MKYKIETHLHTSESSRCGHLTGAQMVSAYAEAGYHAIIVSDHYSPSFFRSLGDMPWEEKVERFCAGYEAAQAASAGSGVTVLFAAEIQFLGSCNHFLAYGITKQFMLEHPKLYKMDPSDFYAMAKENGFLVVQAHPLRDGVSTPNPVAADGFEVCNTNPRHENFDEEVERLCLENRLLRTGGSDAHRPEDVAGSGVVCDEPICSMREFIDLIKSGKAQVIGRAEK